IDGVINAVLGAEAESGDAEISVHNGGDVGGSVIRRIGIRYRAADDCDVGIASERQRFDRVGYESDRSGRQGAEIANQRAAEVGRGSLAGSGGERGGAPRPGTGLRG